MSRINKEEVEKFLEDENIGEFKTLNRRRLINKKKKPETTKEVIINNNPNTTVKITSKLDEKEEKKKIKDEKKKINKDKDVKREITDFEKILEEKSQEISNIINTNKSRHSFRESILKEKNNKSFEDRKSFDERLFEEIDTDNLNKSFKQENNLIFNNETVEKIETKKKTMAEMYDDLKNKIQEIKNKRVDKNVSNQEEIKEIFRIIEDQEIPQEDNKKEEKEKKVFINENLNKENLDDSYDSDSDFFEIDEMEVEYPISYSEKVGLTFLGGKAKEFAKNADFLHKINFWLDKLGFEIPVNSQMYEDKLFTKESFFRIISPKIYRGNFKEEYKVIKRRPILQPGKNKTELPDFITKSRLYQSMKNSDMFKGEDVEQILGKELLLSAFYLNKYLNKEDNLTEFNENENLLNSILKNIKISKDLNEQVEKQVNDIIKDSKYYPEKSDNAFRNVYTKIKFLDKDYQIKEMKPMEIANFVINRYKNHPCDIVMMDALAKYCPIELNELAEILETTYFGTGTPLMSIERYQLSKEIYDQTNTIEKKEFHAKVYSEEFATALEYLNLIPVRKNLNLKMPTIAEEFVLTTLKGVDNSIVRIIDVNNKARGTILTNSKRKETAMQEISVALKNFEKLNTDTNAEEYFRICFRNIVAKSKQEIHTTDKPPRFYNPTNISGFIPFQYMLNAAFTMIPNFDEGNESNLLGISDTGHTFANIMSKLYKGNCRMHYSDNFWISDDKFISSIDVKRCDSNLSKESLLYPIMFYANYIMCKEDADKLIKLAKIFIEEIPHKAFFSIGRKKEKRLFESDFYWLPSGVVGTAYFNHCFTGMFLYLTRNIKWFDESGNFTEELRDMAEKFGIKLQISTLVEKEKIELHDDVAFDLLGRYGIYLGNDVFVPHLEFKRMWKSIAYIKPKYYEKGGVVSAFIRLAKLDSLINMGALLDDKLIYAIYIMYVIILAGYRTKIMNLNDYQFKIIQDMLLENDLDINSLYYLLFSNKIFNLEEYIQNKTGTLLNIPKKPTNIIKQIIEKIGEFDQLKNLFIEVIDDDDNINIDKFETQNKKTINYNIFDDVLKNTINEAKNKYDGIFSDLDYLGKYFERLSNRTDSENILTGILKSYLAEGDSKFSNKLCSRLEDDAKKYIDTKDLSNNKKQQAFNIVKKNIYDLPKNKFKVRVGVVMKGGGKYSYQILTDDIPLQTLLNRQKFSKMFEQSFQPIHTNINNFKKEFLKYNNLFNQRFILGRDFDKLNKNVNLNNIELKELDKEYKDLIQNMTKKKMDKAISFYKFNSEKITKESVNENLKDTFIDHVQRVKVYYDQKKNN